jgi:hypothetical protein
MSSSTTPHPTTLTYRSPFLMKPGCGCWLGPMSLVVYLSMLGLRMLPEQTMQANRMLALYIFCFVLLCSSLVFFVFVLPSAVALLPTLYLSRHLDGLLLIYKDTRLGVCSRKKKGELLDKQNRMLSFFLLYME